MKTSVGVLAALLLSVLAAPAARADTITVDYDFRSGAVIPTTHASLNFLATGVTPPLLSPGQVPQILATGQAFSESPFTVLNSYVSQSVAGLGVYWTGTVSTFIGTLPAFDTDGAELDGLGPDEALNLTFHSFGSVADVELVMAGFTLTNEFLSGGNEQAKFYRNNVLLGTITLPNTLLTPAFVDLSGYGISLDPGDIFTIRVNGGNDDFVVMGVRITASTVPEPALSALLLAGLLGIGVHRARRRAA